MSPLSYALLAVVALSGDVALAQNTPSTGSCTCTCFDGRPLAVCGNGPEAGFVCTPAVCPSKPPAPLLQPQPSTPAPLNKTCRLELGVNPANGQNEFKTVCK